MNQYDVAVVGAGMAGLTAARDLSTKGYEVVLLEGRDRIGGRTFVGDAMGMRLELGGAYVHWTQPHVWHELQKHGLTIQPGTIESNKIYWLADGTVHTGTKEDYSSALSPILERLFADARSHFPRPYDLSYISKGDWERETLADRIKALKLSAYEQDLIEGALSGVVHSCDKHGTSQLLHGVATFFGNYQAFFETAGSWAIKEGTKGMADAVLSESSAVLRLSTPVSSLEDRGTDVVVTSRAGEIIQACAVVLAVPLNTIGSIAIEPELPSAVRSMIDERNPIVSAQKLWIRVRGAIPPFRAFAPAGKHPLNTVRTERRLDCGDTLIMSICSDATMLEAVDTAAVQLALRKFVPDVEVVEVASHDWSRDEFSQGGWMMHRPGHFTNGAVQIRKPHGRIHFAGSDVAAMETGSIEGAMQSGAFAARQVDCLIKQERQL